MKKFIQNIKNIWKVEELRKRILLTLGLILVYRVGSYVFLPGIDYNKMMESARSTADDSALETLLSLFSEGNKSITIQGF